MRRDRTKQRLEGIDSKKVSKIGQTEENEGGKQHGSGERGAAVKRAENRESSNGGSGRV